MEKKITCKDCKYGINIPSKDPEKIMCGRNWSVKKKNNTCMEAKVEWYFKGNS